MDATSAETLEEVIQNLDISTGFMANVFNKLEAFSEFKRSNSR